MLAVAPFPVAIRSGKMCKSEEADSMEEERKRRRRERQSTQRVEENKEESNTKRRNWDWRVCCDLHTTQ